MRVISLKNYCESTRVIIQLLHYHNKVDKKNHKCNICPNFPKILNISWEAKCRLSSILLNTPLNIVNNPWIANAHRHLSANSLTTKVNILASISFLIFSRHTLLVYWWQVIFILLKTWYLILMIVVNSNLRVTFLAIWKPLSFQGIRNNQITISSMSVSVINANLSRVELYIVKWYLIGLPFEHSWLGLEAWWPGKIKQNTKSSSCTWSTSLHTSTTRQFASTRSSLASWPSPAWRPASSRWRATWWRRACQGLPRRCRAGRRTTSQPPTKSSWQRHSLQLLSASHFRCENKHGHVFNFKLFSGSCRDLLP